MMPIAGAAIASLISAVPGIIQGITGINQRRDAQRYRDEFERPDYEIPGATKDAVGYANRLTHRRELPGQSYYENLISGATSKGLDAVKEMGMGSEGFGAIANIVSNEQSQLSGLSAKAAEMVRRNEGQYLNTLGMLSDQQSKKWQWEEAEPYLQAMQIARQLEGTGTKNLFEGTKDMIGVGAGYLSTPGMFGNEESDKGFTMDSDQFKQFLEQLKPE